MATKLQKVKTLGRELNGLLEYAKMAKGLHKQVSYHANALESLRIQVSVMNEDISMRADRIMKLAIEVGAPPAVMDLAKEAIELARAFRTAEREERPGVR